MRYDETVLRMREHLVAEGAELEPEAADRDAVYTGSGDIRPAWRAFRAVAQEPATDAVEFYGETVDVVSAGVMLEAGASPRGHLELSFTLEFEIGEHGSMAGLFFVIQTPLDPDMRVEDVLTDHRPHEPDAVGRRAWLDDVERLSAVEAALAQPSQRFSFFIETIG